MKSQTVWDFPDIWKPGFSNDLAPVVQTMDSAVHRINYYPADKHPQNQLSYPVDSDLSRGQRYPAFEQLEPDGKINRTFWQWSFH